MLPRAAETTWLLQVCCVSMFCNLMKHKYDEGIKSAKIITVFKMDLDAQGSGFSNNTQPTLS